MFVSCCRPSPVVFFTPSVLVAFKHVGIMGGSGSAAYRYRFWRTAAQHRVLATSWLTVGCFGVPVFVGVGL